MPPPDEGSIIPEESLAMQSIPAPPRRREIGLSRRYYFLTVMWIGADGACVPPLL